MPVSSYIRDHFNLTYRESIALILINYIYLRVII